MHMAQLQLSWASVQLFSEGYSAKMLVTIYDYLKKRPLMMHSYIILLKECL